MTAPTLRDYDLCSFTIIQIAVSVPSRMSPQSQHQNPWVCTVAVTAQSNLWNRFKLQAVLGPAVDGGYYLIGMTKPVEELFQVRSLTLHHHRCYR